MWLGDKRSGIPDGIHLSNVAMWHQNGRHFFKTQNIKQKEDMKHTELNHHKYYYLQIL